MFTHILIPTDGSPLSDAAAHQVIRFAKDIGAKVTGIHVVPEFHVFTYQAEMLEDTREQFEKDCRTHAMQFLSALEKTALESGVECKTMYVRNDHPYEAILDTAKEAGCDLIAMASHGRKGVKGMLMGSETQKVLTHSDLPVLVYR